MKAMILQDLDRGYDPYNPRALVEVEVMTEDEACDEIEKMLAVIGESRRERAARSRSRAGSSPL